MSTRLLKRLAAKPQAPRIARGNPYAQGLRGAWFLGEGCGSTTLNAAWMNYAGTLSGATPPAWASSPYGRCLTFNGSTSYVVAGTVDQFNFLVTTAVFTISARIRFANYAADLYQIIFGGTTGSSNKDAALSWDNRVSSGSLRRLNLLVGAGAGSGNYAINMGANGVLGDNGWHHVAAVANVAASAGAIYVDGVSMALDTLSFAATPAGPLTAAPNLGRSTAGAFYFGGDMEHVMIWDRALTAGEVSALAADPYLVLATAPGPWRFGAAAAAGTAKPVLFHSHYLNQGWR